MSYHAWFQNHGDKHRRIVSRLMHDGLSVKEIIDYFDFDNMINAEPEFCELYAEKRKCHDMARLNCYLCACPHFRFDDAAKPGSDGMTRYSACSVASKEGATVTHDNALHHDCSRCTVPHHRSYVEKYFELDWFEAMAACEGPFDTKN